MDRGKLTEYELNLRNEIAKNLKKLLKEKGMTQKKLSEQTEIPTSTISDYLNAKSLALPGNVQKMAMALKVSKGKIDPSFSDDSKALSDDPRIAFFDELEKDLGLDLTDPNVQRMLKKAAKLFFTDKD